MDIHLLTANSDCYLQFAKICNLNQGGSYIELKIYKISGYI